MLTAAMSHPGSSPGNLPPGNLPPGNSLDGNLSPGNSSPGGGEGPRLPALPDVGLDEHVYAHHARKADELGDRHARESAKVGLYITLALDPNMDWHEKLRHFTHALNKHCHASPFCDQRVWTYYHALAVLVKTHCGQEALKIASRQDDLYAARLSMGTPRERIEREAKRFFDDIIGHGKECPEYLLPDDFTMIRMIRDQWV